MTSEPSPTGAGQRQFLFGGLRSHPATLWITKHVISPLDRFVVKFSRGRVPPLTSFFVPTLLLKVVGRRSGSEYATPLVYVNDGARYIVGNARPKGERRNPWVLNLRAARRGVVVLRRRELEVTARELEGEELRRWFAALTKVWPALSDHYAATGERSVFVLEPIDRKDSADE